MATSTKARNPAAAAGLAAFAPIPKSVTNAGNNVPINARINYQSIGELSLQNGMTAGYGVQDGHVVNPPAYKGTYGGNPRRQPNRIGLMRNVPGSITNPKGVSQVFALYFIFNPSQIQVNLVTNTSSIPSNYLYGGASTGANVLSQSGAGTTNNAGFAATAGASSDGFSVPNLTNSQTVSFSLIFDRTYDMLYGKNPQNNRGVLEDVAALYNLMGTFETTGAVPMSTPVQVVFGQNAGGGGQGQLWGFTGFISAVTITYPIFKFNMIPSRCEVDITMTATYVSGITPPASKTGTKPLTTAQTQKTVAGFKTIASTVSGQNNALATAQNAGGPPSALTKNKNVGI